MSEISNLDYRNRVLQRLQNPNVESTRTLRKNPLLDSAGKSVLTNQRVSDTFEKLGVERSSTSTINLKSKKIDSLLDAGISEGDITGDKKTGFTAKVNGQNLDQFILTSGNTAIDDLKNSGINIEQTADGLKFDAESLSKDQKLSLKKAGLSKSAIEELEKEGTYSIKGGTMESLQKSAGKGKLVASKAKIEEVTTHNITAGVSEWGKKAGESLGKIYQKAAGLVGAKVGEDVVETAGEVVGKNVGKVGALAAKGSSTLSKGNSLLMFAFELPKIIKASKDENGNFSLSGALKQVGRSGINVGASLGAAAIGGAIGTALIPIPVVGTTVGMIAGDLIGGAIGYQAGKKVSDELLGESPADDNLNPKAGLAARQAARAAGM